MVNIVEHKEPVSVENIQKQLRSSSMNYHPGHHEHVNASSICTESVVDIE